MEEEIEGVIENREVISPSNLEYGNLVFIRRDKAKYP